MPIKITNHNLMVTIPHAGEKIPDECEWLKQLPETILMEDVDRFVDVLYLPTLEKFDIPNIKTLWHRYAVDLNRVPTDIDEASVVGSKNKKGQFPRGYHWSMTTKLYPIMPQAISAELHQHLTDLIFTPFHHQIQELQKKMQLQLSENKLPIKIYHLDLHSMPSLGTSEHRDPGELRADIVVSDSLGKSSEKAFVDKVITSYCRAGFKVGYNWPYYGGRLTEQYGQPQKNVNTVQVELNRSLYMDELTKKMKADKLEQIQKKLEMALQLLMND